MHSSLLLVSSLFFLLFFQVSDASLGLDISSSGYTVDIMKCLLDQNYTFAIVRAYRSLGKCDVNAPISMASAWKANFKRVDVYLFPCFKCKKSPAAQINEALDCLDNWGVSWGRIWIDVEGVPHANDEELEEELDLNDQREDLDLNELGWSKNKTINQIFFTSMADTLMERGLTWEKCGVYASHRTWTGIMGEDWNGAAKYNWPAWYAHYDLKPSFYDFKPYGGWEKPFMKQFKGGTKISQCHDKGIDKDYTDQY